MIVTLVGPIDYWWNENWHTDQHVQFLMWRSEISRQLVEAGHLVYRPHEAFKGAWNEKAQLVNDQAIVISDVLINLCPPGVPAYGTEKECLYAKLLGIPILSAPPRDDTQISHLLERLPDPYSNVNRKSYTKEKP